MLAGATLAELPLAGGFNIVETIVANPVSPYTLPINVAISTITITCDDLDLGTTTLRYVSGSLPTGLSLSRALPATVAVPFNTTITGIPTVAGAFSVTYENDDGVDSTTQIQLNFTITVPSNKIGLGYLCAGVPFRNGIL